MSVMVRSYVAYIQATSISILWQMHTIQRLKLPSSLLSMNGSRTSSLYYLANYSGSISAEHGLGLMKAEKIGFSKDALSIQIMTDIKRVFDPKGLMNPYKYLPCT